MWLSSCPTDLGSVLFPIGFRAPRKYPRRSRDQHSHPVNLMEERRKVPSRLYRRTIWNGTIIGIVHNSTRYVCSCIPNSISFFMIIEPVQLKTIKSAAQLPVRSKCPSGTCRGGVRNSKMETHFVDRSPLEKICLLVHDVYLENINSYEKFRYTCPHTVQLRQKEGRKRVR